MAIDKEDVTPAELQPIVETPAWVEHLPALETNVILRAGDNGEGAMNFQARVLDARTRYLLQLIGAAAGGPINLIGELQDEDELNAIPTEGLKAGDCYFVEFAMRVWNGTAWASSGSLRGKNGLNLLGLWPDNLELPEITENEIGDAYIWRHDIHVLVPSQGTKKWEALGIRGPQGESVYEGWVQEPGNEGKTFQEFLESQKGPQGDDAYEAWKKIAGNENKTREQWAEATRGLQGLPGKNLAILGTVADETELQTKDKVDQAAYVLRDTSHLWVYVEADLVWKDLGKFNGKDGKSSYQNWLDLGNTGTEQQFNDSLKGKDGTDGRNVTITGAVDKVADLPSSPTNQDAYTIRETGELYMYIVDGWVNLGRFQGANGTSGVSLILKGAFDTVAELPTDAEDQDIYGVREDNSIYGYIVNAWVRLGQFKGDKGDIGEQGPNSVEYWLSLPGNEGKTEADYWAAMKGADGADGKNLQVNGSVADETALNAIQNPQDQDAYVVNSTHRLWVWSTAGGGWKDLGPFKGADGKSAYQNWLDLGNSGDEEDFNTSLKGKDGQSIKLTGVVATFDDLPASPAADSVYSVQAENALYAWLQGAWLLMGSFKGADGKDGKSLDIIKILTEEDQVVPPATEANKGKAYIDLDKFVFINVSGSAWENGGKFQGQTGDIGKPGTGLKLRGEVDDVTHLPIIGTEEGQAAEGDAYQTLDDKATWVVVDGQWNGPFDFTGPQGRDGQKGDNGATVAIKDSFVDMAALKAAHPTGSATDAYMLENGHLAIWSTALNDWKDVGQFQGPEGKQGPEGVGKQGVPGLKGDQGSRWLTLPEGTDEPTESFNGRVGDWAVSKDSLKVFYKTANQGWQFWGFLVAGDVNSPLLSLGKVVRLGDNWVPLPVDEVPTPVADKIYGRKLKDGSSTVLEWKEIVFPVTIQDLQTKDDAKQFARVFRTNTTVPEWKEVVIKFDRYDLAIKAVSATIQIDPAVDQVVNLDNTGNTAKAVSIKDHVAGRAMPVVLRIKGTAGAVTYGGTNIKWDTRTNNGNPPELSTAKTVIIFFWDGENWIGNLSSTTN